MTAIELSNTKKYFERSIATFQIEKYLALYNVFILESE
jgi:hypothetical protein